MQECRNGCVGNSEINPIRKKKKKSRCQDFSLTKIKCKCSTESENSSSGNCQELGKRAMQTFASQVET